MTPKEKALDLVNNFKQHSYYDAHGLTTRMQREESNKNSAVECALIAVDEILSTIQDLKCEDVNWDYWIEVKKEIDVL